WDNLREGREALRTFNADELIGNGFSAGVVANPAFVASAALLDEVERFDAEFFRMTPREAEVLDPQQRLLLECSVQALESAGYGDGARPRRCGVFLGCGESTYLANHLLANMALLRDLGLNVLHANSNHYLATRIAYKLDLTGPAVNIATACSTSLVAVHEAVASLRAGECE
ncbi:polyketide synthase, partial [Staphylococcus aureus]|nr:polyketide synthase [Staphylococcus aureus]